MLREMSRLELQAWLAYLKVGSLDDEKADGRMAVIASAAMNGPHFLKRDKKPYAPVEFIPNRERPDIGSQIKAFFTPRMKKAK